MVRPIKYAYTCAEFNFQLMTPPRNGSMKVFVGLGERNTGLDAVITVKHIYVDRVDRKPTDDAIFAEHVFRDHGIGNIRLFTRRDGKQHIGIIQERMGWRTMTLSARICAFRVAAASEMLKLARKSGCHTATLDYPSTFDDRWLDYNLHQPSEYCPSTLPLVSPLDLEHAKRAIHVRLAQTATLLEGVKQYARAIAGGEVDYPLEEVNVGLNENAYAVWLYWSGRNSIKPYLKFDPPEPHFKFELKG